VGTVKSGLNRLKKKMGLNAKETLRGFLDQLSEGGVTVEVLA